jgi:hypothetical protein
LAEALANDPVEKAIQVSTEIIRLKQFDFKKVFTKPSYRKSYLQQYLLYG